MKPERVIRYVLRCVANIFGAFVILALTATSFDRTEMTALFFLTIWFGVIEVVIACAGVKRLNGGDKTGQAQPVMFAVSVLIVLLTINAVTKLCKALYQPPSIKIEWTDDSGARGSASSQKLPWQNSSDYWTEAANLVRTAGGK